MQAVLKLQNSLPQDTVNTKTLRELEKLLDTFTEKKSSKDTTAGQEIPEPPLAESGRAEMLPSLPSGSTLPKEQHLLLATVGVKISKGLDLWFHLLWLLLRY